jgi:hypothetical protein
MNITSENEDTATPQKNVAGVVGWVVAAILFLTLVIVVAAKSSGEKNADLAVPSITKITFYNEDKEEVHEEALWYNASDIEGIMIQWKGGCPDTIKMFATPSGSNTIDETKLLLTKEVKDNDFVELLDADAFKDYFMIHLYFQLDFAGTIVKSADFNVIYGGYVDNTISQEDMYH